MQSIFIKQDPAMVLAKENYRCCDI